MRLDSINFRDGTSWISLKDLIYPVGSIFMKATDTDNPGKVIGDTWAQIQGKFLLGASSSYAIKSTGGAVTHTLTVNEMPSHNHYSGYGYHNVVQQYSGLAAFSCLSWEPVWGDGNSSNQTSYYGGGATSQQYATLSSRCYLGENSLAFLLEVL